MGFVLKHIRILEADRQIEVISPSWDMGVKNYKMPDDRTVVFRFDENGIGKISLEAMDVLMEMIGAKEIEEWNSYSNGKIYAPKGTFQKIYDEERRNDE